MAEPIFSQIAKLEKMYKEFEDAEKTQLFSERNEKIPHTYPSTMQVKDDRVIRATTQKPVVATRDLKSGVYDSNVIYRVMKAAKDRGYDPWRAAAVALQETGFGKSDENIGHVLHDAPEVLELDDTQINNELYTGEAAKMVNFLISKEKEAESHGHKSQEMKLQYYNGTGRLTPKTESSYYERTGRGSKQQSFYGVPIPKEGYIDVKKNPLYGKEVEDLRAMLMRNPDFKTMGDTINAPTYQNLIKNMKLPYYSQKK
jgi:hypothetical protein